MIADASALWVIEEQDIIERQACTEPLGIIAFFRHHKVHAFSLPSALKLWLPIAPHASLAMPASDVVDLCSGDSDSDADLPPLASLTARLQQRRAGSTSAAATAAAVTAATAAAPQAAQPNSGARTPLLAVHNQSAGGLPGKQRAGELEHDSPPRAQYHQQEQRQEQQQQHPSRATPPAAPSSGPRRGKRTSPGADGCFPFESQHRASLAALDDEEWRPGDSPAGQHARKQRRPKRTREEIEADKALKVRPAMLDSCRQYHPILGHRSEPCWC